MGSPIGGGRAAQAAGDDLTGESGRMIIPGGGGTT